VGQEAQNCTSPATHQRSVGLGATPRELLKVRNVLKNDALLLSINGSAVGVRWLLVLSVCLLAVNHCESTTAAMFQRLQPRNQPKTLDSAQDIQSIRTPTAGVTGVTPASAYCCCSDLLE